MRLIISMAMSQRMPVALAGDVGERAGRRGAHGGGESIGACASIGPRRKRGSRPWASTCPAAAIQPAGLALMSSSSPRTDGFRAAGRPWVIRCTSFGYVVEDCATSHHQGHPATVSPIRSSEARHRRRRAARSTATRSVGASHIRQRLRARGPQPACRSPAPARRASRPHRHQPHGVHPVRDSHMPVRGGHSCQGSAIRTLGQLVQPHRGVDLVITGSPALPSSHRAHAPTALIGAPALSEHGRVPFVQPRPIRADHGAPPFHHQSGKAACDAAIPRSLARALSLFPQGACPLITWLRCRTDPPLRHWAVSWTTGSVPPAWPTKVISYVWGRMGLRLSPVVHFAAHVYKHPRPLGARHHPGGVAPDYCSTAEATFLHFRNTSEDPCTVHLPEARGSVRAPRPSSGQPTCACSEAGSPHQFALGRVRNPQGAPTAGSATVPHG